MNPDDLTLAIETSNPAGCGLVPQSLCGVALARGRERLGVEPMNPEARHDDDLMPAIDRLCRAQGIARRDLNRIAVSIGPGGFTGLRVAVTTAKFIAYACGGVCIGVPTPLVLAHTAARPLPSRFAIALGSKAEHAFISLIEPDGLTLVGLRDAAGVLALAPTRVVADRHLPATIRAACERAEIPVDLPRYDPWACAEVSFDLPHVLPDELVPLYAREPEAVTLWNARRHTGK